MVPYVRPPQPLPSVYSAEEIQQVEAQVRNDAINGITSVGKRNYAMLLMAARLGLRPCDIVSLTFSELDFQAETIRIIQEKTGALLELPMFSVIRERELAPSSFAVSRRVLLSFDQHLEERKKREKSITEDDVFTWLQPKYAALARGTIAPQVCCLRKFSEYLQQQGFSAYIPPNTKKLYQ